MRARLVAIALLGTLLAGCGDQTVTPTAPTSNYRQASRNLTPDLANTTPYTPPSSLYPATHSPSVAPSTASAPTPAPSPDPLAGSGVTAAIRDQKTTGWFKHHLRLTVAVTNHDDTEHAGFLIATFTRPDGTSELAYQAVSVSSGGTETVTLTSVGAASSAVVEFKERLI